MKVILLCFILAVGILHSIYAKPFGPNSIGTSLDRRVNDFLKKGKERLFEEKLARLVGLLFEKSHRSFIYTFVIYIRCSKLKYENRLFVRELHNRNFSDQITITLPNKKVCAQ